MVLTAKGQEIFDNLEEISVNLLLTESCNMACAHCMYSCKPQIKAKQQYMSFADIEVILQLIAEAQEKAELRNNPYSIILNLVGGEPTLDLDKFHNICDYLEGHPVTSRVKLEMTTNGWWLRSWQTICQFAKAVGPLLLKHELIIRISNSIYHDKFRSSTEKLIFQAGLSSVFETPYDYLDMPVCCNDCDELLEHQYCKKCDRELGSDEYAEVQDRAFCISGHNWVATLLTAVNDGNLFIESKLVDESRVTSVGRAQLNNIGWQKVQCWRAGSAYFTFKPGAKLQGICCNGGNVPLGHASDGLEYLFSLATSYIQDIKTKYKTTACENCSSFAHTWKNQYLKTLSNVDCSQSNKYEELYQT